MNFFSNRKLIIATKHKKETAIAPLLEKSLGIISFIDEEFDTDQLGTFSGEIERKLGPIETLRKKCLLAMEKNKCDLGIASEGSFGAHPSYFFLNADDEFLIFIDKINNIEIIVRELSTDTNIAGQEISTMHHLIDFAKQVQFPSHGLIIRKSKEDYSKIEKGIDTWEDLKKIFNIFLKDVESVYVETDMRANFNPTRMKVIEKATIKLVEKILSECPKCFTPGFGITDVKTGLPCHQCKFPTKYTFAFIYKCEKCSFQKEEKYPHDKKTEDPMYCDICNP